ncbi:cold shock domain-containing protein E1 isoform X1 [Diorhabda carinulata]|uniref:cold shock domain-containing protein E1 isoform X1 n=1 Tax=Diorhabda carinulata TaxID=1163345 RepID=UPI0025A2F5A8|nr:cold shock domain-containing protein E1 isoform X1 [Diorhabda carinulata]XP_057655392.1 cold shock domain-containing protein E1 isoform X1 [Diorhabda carinulata]
MSTNPQWKNFQPPPDTITQDTSIMDFKPMASTGKPSQAFNFTRSTSSSRFGDFPLLQEKSLQPYNNGLYGSSSTTHTSPRFPIGTFSLDSTNNVYNSSGDNSLNNTSIFSNGNNTSTSYNNDSSNSSNLGTRETGIIEKLLHSYGFIQCCERQARLFFHFSQFSGNIEHLKIGDPVEFEMTYDRRTGKPIASAVTKIAPEVVMSEERVTGTVTTELRSAEGSAGDTTGRISYENRGECFFLPYTKDDVEGNVTLRSGDKVSFQIATNNRGNLGACHVRLENPAHPVKYQGVVCSMKESFGFIERADVVKEIFFHFSEAKTKEELRLGDDVEYIIQTRNGKEVACNITRLPPGTVIFEDLKADIMKGQVLKPIDRGPRNPNDALPGRIRYRAADHSEVEISFSEKDQMGDFTLRHGDWVQFQIATDRRDALDRATHIMLLDESFKVSGEKREQGVVCSVKEGFGFLRCVEREARLFFHFNEILDVERTNEVQVGDEFEFTVVQDQTSSGMFSSNRQSAIRMKWLPPGTVQFEIRIENDLTGIVTSDLPLSNWNNRSPTKNQNGLTGENSNPECGLIGYSINGIKKTISFYAKDCNPKQIPRVGDKVQFNINQVKRNKEFIAVDVQIVQPANQTNGIKQVITRNNGAQVYQGFIAALKDGFGFIETMQHDKEVFFHFSNFGGESSSLDLGTEVEYNLGTRGNSGSCSSAENVKVIPKGTITLPEYQGDILEGTVVRPLRSVNPDQNEYSGLIRTKSENHNDKVEEYEFGIMGLVNKRELLQVGDHVQFQVDTTGRAANIVAVRKKLKATVDAIKGHFGFLAYEVEEGKKLFFHMTEVKDNASLQVGDTVEFVLVTNHRSGKSSACNVVKVSNCHLYYSDVQARPERLISRLRTISVDDTGPKLMVMRQPKGPDGSKGFSSEARSNRIPGVVPK